MPNKWAKTKSEPDCLFSDAILDRIVHDTHRVEITVESLRKQSKWNMNEYLI